MTRSKHASDIASSMAHIVEPLSWFSHLTPAAAQIRRNVRTTGGVLHIMIRQLAFECSKTDGGGYK